MEMKTDQPQGNIINIPGLNSVKILSERSAQKEKKSLPESWISLLFLRFQAIWGNKWTNLLANDEIIAIAKAEWGESLADMSGDDIKRGIEYCRSTLVWPPSIAEFISACKMSVSRTTKIDEFVRQDSTPESKALADKARAEMRKKLGLVSRDAV